MTAPLRALVVDDEEAMRTALARLLGTKGFEVETAASGAEAVALARPGRYDLVILDMWMPKMNGLETLEKFRKIDPIVSVIAVSGMGTDATALAARRAGATGFLPKPFTVEDIQQMMKSAVTGHDNLESTAVGARKGWRGRILVADDHEAYRTAVARRLRLDGYDVDEVSTGAEAAIAAEGISYDALLLDIHMPSGDGLMAAESVRTRDPFLPILFMTGEASEDEVRRGLKSSTSGCLRKPVDMVTLGRMLEFLIAVGGRSQRRAEARAAYDALPPMTKAVIAAGEKAKKIRRSPETRVIVIGMFIAVIIALFLMTLLDAGQRAMMHIERSFENTPGPVDMYRNIVGYLERDEQRELKQDKDKR